MAYTKYNRNEILNRLKEVITMGRPIIGAGCSAGIIAKCAEIGGADLIIVYSTGKSRLMGLPTTRLGDSNKITLEMAEEILNVIKNTPIIAGIDATDPRSMDLEILLEKFLRAGYSGLINFPSVGVYGDYRRSREQVGLGFSRELELIRIARQAGIFTMGYAYNETDAVQLATVGVDCLVAHVGGTAGGLTGFKKRLSLNQAAKRVQDIVEQAKKVNSNIIFLAHGGPYGTPKDTKHLYKNAGVAGFVGASSIERIPIEKAVIRTVRMFKAVDFDLTKKK